MEIIMSIHLFLDETANADSQKLNSEIMITQVRIENKAEELKKMTVLAVENSIPRGALANVCVLLKKEASTTTLFKGRLYGEMIPMERGLCQITFMGEKDEAAKSSQNPLDITAFVFDQSIQWVNPIPPSWIHLVVQAEWIQQEDGVIDIMPEIEAQFPQGKINSLNPELTIPKHHIDRTGYTTLEVSLKRVSGLDTGGLNIYPDQTDALMILDHEEKKRATLPRYWFQGAWMMAWHYEQKRIERAHCKIPFYSNALSSSEAEEVSILLKLQNSDAAENFDKALPRFFASDRGISVMNEAIHTVQKSLHEKYRQTLIFKAHFDCLDQLKIGQTIILQTELKKIKGTLKRVKAMIEGNSQYLEIECSVIPSWLEEWSQNAFEVSEFTDQSKLIEIGPDRSSQQSWVEEIHIENDALEQFDGIQALNVPTLSDIKRFLSEHKTQVVIYLKSLKTHRALTHDVLAHLQNQ